MLKEAIPRAEDIRDYNIGESDYSKHKIQPWIFGLNVNLILLTLILLSVF